MNTCKGEFFNKQKQKMQASVLIIVDHAKNTKVEEESFM